MKIFLAGHNVDMNLIEQMKKQHPELSDKFTPETISAAYARISRDPRPVNELREIAVNEVEKAKKSNQAIIFDMGHSSVAEHVVFNFDVIGLSRLAIEELEHFRLASYTEKSQRYVTLTDDYVVPEEISDAADVLKFKEIIALQNEFYHELYAKLREHVFEQNSELAKEPKNHRLLEGWAKEDARYICALATLGQLGMTINARTLELMLRRFAASDLAEVRELGLSLYNQVKDIAPSVVRYTKATDYDKNKYSAIKNYTDIDVKSTKRAVQKAKLVSYTQDLDDLVVAALLHTVSKADLDDIETVVKKLSKKEKQKILKDALKNIKLYDTVLREFEFADFVFEVSLSAACFGQLKRHRLCTITSQNYDINLAVEIPQAIVEVGFREKFLAVVEKTNEVYVYFKKKYSAGVGNYVLTNSHKRKVLVKINARALYHLSRLREDEHAQWDIRNISSEMVKLAKEVAPITTFLMCGKSSFSEVYEREYLTKIVIP